MNTLVELTTKRVRKRQALLRPNVRRAHVPTTAMAQKVTCDEEMIHVALTDGRIISVPLVWFPTLADAATAQRERCEIGGGGFSLHWPELDEDLSVANLLAGADWEST